MQPILKMKAILFYQELNCQLKAKGVRSLIIRTGPYAYFSCLFIRVDIISHDLHNIYHVTFIYSLGGASDRVLAYLSRQSARAGIIPFCLRSWVRLPPGTVFFWLVGRLELGTRSWVRIGLGVRLGSVFSLFVRQNYCRTNNQLSTAYRPVWMTPA